MSALSRVLDSTSFVVIGAIKSNLGHTETASGLLGVIKTALLLHNCYVTPNLHFRSLNSSIVLEASRLLSTESAATSNMPKQLLISGVSSFGFSGTNAHVVLACEKSAMVLVQTGQVVQVCYSQAAFGWWDDA